MATTKISITINANSPLDAPLFIKALESIAKHFTAAELIKVAKKIEDPIVRSQIKSMI